MEGLAGGTGSKSYRGNGGRALKKREEKELEAEKMKGRQKLGKGEENT